MSRKSIITEKLEKAFQPDHLEVLDESHMHEGHGGIHNRVDTHFRIRIRAAEFAGMSRVNIHRAINAVLADELAAGLHALAIEASGP